MIDDRHNLLITKDFFELCIDYFHKVVQIDFFESFIYEDDSHHELSDQFLDWANNWTSYNIDDMELEKYAYDYYLKMGEKQKLALYMHAILKHNDLFEEDFESDMDTDEATELYFSDKYKEKFGRYVARLLYEPETTKLIEYAYLNLRNLLYNFISEFSEADEDEYTYEKIKDKLNLYKW